MEVTELPLLMVQHLLYLQFLLLVELKEPQQQIQTVAQVVVVLYQDEVG